MVPYDKASPRSSEDAFNFYLSSSRIYVKCAFGEIDRRWGILWRQLEFTLRKSTEVIDACMRLHNFLVDYRETNKNKELSAGRVSNDKNLERSILDLDSLDLS